MKLTKRIITIFFAVCLIVVMVPFSVMADDVIPEENGILYQTELDTKEDVFNLDKKTPSDYVKDGATPGGLTKDQDVQIIQANELVTLESTKESGHLSKMKTKAYDQVIDKATLPYNYTAENGVMIDSVAFDPTHTGKKDHLAVMAVKQTSSEFDVYLDIYALSDMSLLKSQKLTTLDNNYFNFSRTQDTVKSFYNMASMASRFIQIKVGSFDGKYDDCLVASIMPLAGYKKMADDGKDKEVISIFRCTVDNKTCTLTTFKTLTYGECFTNLANFNDFSIPHMNYFRFKVGVTCGDFDRDTIDEIGLTFSFFDIFLKDGFKHTTVGYQPKDYATEVVVLDNISTTSKPEKAFDDFILKENPGRTTTEEEAYWGTYASVCATGDVDANRAEDLIIGGRQTAFSVSKDHQTITSNFTEGFPTISIVSYNGEAGYAFKTHSTMESNDRSSELASIALEAAAAEGLNKPCTIFLNGHLFQYDAVNNTLNERTDDVYSLCKNFTVLTNQKIQIRKVVKGNFTNDENGRESFAFDCLLYQLNEQTHLMESYDYIGYMYPKFETGSDFVIGWENNSPSGDTVTEANANFVALNQKGSDLSTYTPFLLASTDIDDDGLRVQYIGTEYVYTDPRVMAVLEAPPKFKELGGQYVFTGGSTDYNKITGHSHTSQNGFAKTQEYGCSVGFGFSFGDMEEGFGFSIEPKIYGGYTHGSSEEWGETREDTTTQGFSTPIVDSVVVQRRPIACYKYHVWDPETKDWLKDDQGNYYEEATLIYLNPCLFNLSVDEYNEFVDEYNAMIKKNNPNDDDLVYLKRIKTGKDGELDKDAVLVLPLNSQDNPANYFNGSKAGEVPITVKEATAHSLAHDGSAQSFEQQTVKTDYKEESHYSGAHESVTISAGFKFSKLFQLDVEPQFNFSETWDYSSTDTSIRGYSYSGKVEGISPKNYMKYNWNAVKQYGFDWQFATWETVLDTQTGKDGEPANVIPVLGYKVTNVHYPGQAPYDLVAKTENGQVVLTWNKPYDIKEGEVISPTNRTKFKIYRSTVQDEIYIGDGDLVYVGETDINTTSFTEPIDKLEKGKQHNYFVSAVYGNEGDQDSYEAFSRAEIHNYIITAAANVEQMKKLIKSFRDNGENKDLEKVKALLEAYDMMAQNPEIRTKMEAEKELQAWIAEMKTDIKAANQKVTINDCCVSLNAVNGGEPDWKYVLSATAIETPADVKAKLGKDWKVLDARDITVLLNEKPAEGKFTFGFSGKDFAKYKKSEAIVYHVTEKGIEKLKPVWNEEKQCFEVTSKTCSPFVFAVNTKDAPNTGDSNNMLLWSLLLALSIIGLGIGGYFKSLYREE